MKNKKVLFLSRGASPYRVDFFNELGKVMDVTVLYEIKKNSDRHESWMSKVSKNFDDIFLSGVKINSDMALCPQVIKYFKKNYDHIVIGGYSTPTSILSIIYLSIMKIPFILSVDGALMKTEKKLLYFLKKYLITRADYILSTSSETTKSLVHYGALKNRIFQYPFTSVNEQDILKEVPSKELKQSIKQQLNIKEDKVIISVGQFIYRKGFDVLIESVNNLSTEIGVYIVGGIANQEYINLKENSQFKNIHFVDFKSKDELKLFYMASDLFVLPTREDIWGLVINEAMANALPIITTDRCIAGMELVENEYNGYIVPVNNAIELNIQINKILNNENLRNDMAKNSLYIAKSYTIEKMAKMHINIFHNISRNSRVK